MNILRTFTAQNKVIYLSRTVYLLYQDSFHNIYKGDIYNISVEVLYTTYNIQKDYIFSPREVSYFIFHIEISPYINYLAIVKCSIPLTKQVFSTFIQSSIMNYTQLLGVSISGCRNRGVPLYTDVSSFQVVGIEEFHCIQRCLHFRV